MPVWHVSRAPEGAIYVGRGSRWGNPFVVNRNGDRGEVIRAHAEWLKDEIRAGRVTLEDLAGLLGKDLACYCAPHPCHADTLEFVAIWAAFKLRGLLD